MSLFIGKTVHLEIWEMMKGLLGMIVLPSLVAMLVNQFYSKSVAEKWNKTLAPFSKLGLAVVVSINSSVAPYIRHIDKKFIQIALTIFFIAICGYFFAWILGILTKRSRDEVVGMIYTGGMRNISAGAVLAISFFPIQQQSSL